MPAETTPPLQPDEPLRNACAYFVEALELLAADPETQCEAMGDCNVGAEIQHDAAVGRYLVGWTRLTSSQRDGIARLVAALDRLPHEAVAAAEGRAANLRVMRHEAWAPVRGQASELLRALRSTPLA